MSVKPEREPAPWAEFESLAPSLPGDCAELRERLPLVIDLDAILPARLEDELAAAYLRQRPARAAALLGWILEGWEEVEHGVCGDPDFDPAALPFDLAALELAGEAHEEGRPVILLTLGHEALASRLVEVFPFFDDAVATAQDPIFPDLAKAAAVAARCPAGFIAVARSGTDPTRWERSSGAAAFARLGKGERETETPASVGAYLRLWAKAARLHQWAKNLLVFVPIVLGGAALNPAAWLHALVGFLALGLVASGTYLLNDLHDLPDDRRHASKRRRPLASGALPLRHAALAAPLGIIAGLTLAGAAIGSNGVMLAIAYLAGTLAYTFALKRHPIVDAAALACLFTLRLAAGIVFAGVAASPWLLVFSMFLFTSLAFAKRHTEIARLAGERRDRAAGRGYVAADEPVVLALGVASGTGAVFIFVMYLIEEAARRGFYGDPVWLWLAPMALFLWLGRIWLLCGRKELDDDPVAFAVSDGASLALGVAMAGSFAIAWL
jgi:4-hydroxybenzoate polyprenyltransferase